MKSNMMAVSAGSILTALVIYGAWFHTHSAAVAGPSAEMEGVTETAGMAMEPARDQVAVSVTPVRRQLIGVKTGLVEERSLETIIRAAGAVDYDERRVRQINLRVSGWVTGLMADYTGKSVKRGDPLLTLYSPELMATQEEYLLARRTAERVKASPVAHVSDGAHALAESARNRLALWGLTEEQIGQLEQGEPPQTATTIYSPIGGVVTKKMALQGMYATPEMNLYEIADLSTVWIHANIYEHEMPMVKIGQEATVTLTAYPDEAFQGRVIYIAPYLDDETRTVTVRMEFPNPEGTLKPGMAGTVDIKTTAGTRLAVPQDAVLDSGIRTLVFVDKGDGLYEPREVALGRRVDRFYPVLSGVAPGDRVVTSATFLIDSESKLMSAASMMGMLGMGGIRMEQAQMGEMEMGGMDMGGASSPRERTVEGLTMTLSTDPEPPKKGKNRLRLLIRAQGAPVADANVTLGYTMVMPGMGVETVEAKRTKDGIYEAEADFAMRGGWEIEATVMRGQRKPVKATFTISVGK